MLAQIGWHPGKVARNYKYQSRVTNSHKAGCSGGEYHTEAIDKRHLLLCRLCGALFSLRSVFQSPYHQQAVNDADCTKDYESPTPAILFANPTCQPTARDNADIVGNLHNSHRNGAGLFVILRQEWQIVRAKQRLATARSHASHNNQRHETAAQAGKHRTNTPEYNSRGEYPLTADSIAEPTSERHQHRIEEIEDCCNSSNLNIGQGKTTLRQWLLNQRKNHIKRLAVGLIQKEGHPNQK